MQFARGGSAELRYLARRTFADRSSTLKRDSEQVGAREVDARIACRRSIDASIYQLTIASPARSCRKHPTGRYTANRSRGIAPRGEFSRAIRRMPELERVGEARFTERRR